MPSLDDYSDFSPLTRKRATAVMETFNCTLLAPTSRKYISMQCPDGLKMYVGRKGAIRIGHSIATSTPAPGMEVLRIKLL